MARGSGAPGWRRQSHRASAPAPGAAAPAAPRTPEPCRAPRDHHSAHGAAPLLPLPGPAFLSGRQHRVIRAFLSTRVSLPGVSVTPAGGRWPRLSGSSAAQRSLAPSGQCKYLLPARYPEQGPAAGSALPAGSRCAQSPARPGLPRPRQHPRLHRLPPGSASVTAGRRRKATASTARGSSPISTAAPPDPSARLLPAADKGQGREGKPAKSEGKRGWGRGRKLARRETAAFWREMLPRARAVSGVLPGGCPARGTERARVTRTPRTPPVLFKPFALGGDAPASWREWKTSQGSACFTPQAEGRRGKLRRGQG